MKNLILSVLAVVTAFNSAPSFADPSNEQPQVMCLAIAYSLGLEGASQYANNLMTVIEYSREFSDGATYGFSPKSVVEANLEKWLGGPQENIILDEMIAIRDDFYQMVSNERLNIAGFASVEVSEPNYDEYVLKLGVRAVKEGSDVERVYEYTVELRYTYDTCYGEGYTPRETGVLAVKNEAGQVLSTLKIRR